MSAASISCCAAQFITLLVFFATVACRSTCSSIIPKGFFPQQDTGLITGTIGGRPGHLLRRDEAASGGSSARSCMADPDVATIAMAIGGSGSAAQQRPHVHHAEAAQRAQRVRAADHRPAASQARARSRARACSAGGAGRPRRRPADANAVPVHAAGRQSRRTQRLGAEDPDEAEDAAGTARRRDRPADQRHHADADDRSRHGLALRHPAAADRRHAVRRVRPAAGHAIFHPAEQLSRDPGGAAGAAGRSSTR